jgi:nitrilase
MSKAHRTPFTIALAQAAPVFLDRTATVEKACELIVDAGQANARLIVFPAAFIAAYPAWMWTVSPSEGNLLNELYAHLLENAVSIPSDVTDRLCRMAHRARINVVMGLNERDTEADGAMCYNTLLYIDAQGRILGKHRSLVLTGAERLIWTQGDGSTLQVYRLPFGNISGLIGGENYSPLARYTLYAWGTQLYIATSWEHGELWLSTLRHIAKEGHVFVLGCSMVPHSDGIPAGSPYKQFYSPELRDWIHPGASVVINPEGEVIAGPVLEEEALLYAEINPRMLCGPKWMLDVAGYHARPDIFQLTIDREPRPLIRTKEAGSEGNGERVL